MMPSGKPMWMIWIVVNRYGAAFYVTNDKDDAIGHASEEGDKVFRVDGITEVTEKESNAAK